MSFSILIIGAIVVVGLFIVCGVIVAVLAASGGRGRE